MHLNADLLEFLDSLPVAVLLDDDYGVCLYANKATELLLQAAPGSLQDKLCWDIANADPMLVEREHRRLLQEDFWYGRYPMRSGTGVVNVSSVAFTRREPDGEFCCVHLIYPYTPSGRSDKGHKECAAQHRCMLQLMAEGFTHDELATLLGRDGAEVEALIKGAVQAMGARSRTEACILALKSRLVS